MLSREDLAAVFEQGKFKEQVFELIRQGGVAQHPALGEWGRVHY